MKKYALPFLGVLNAALAVCLVWLWVGQDGQLRNVHWQPPQPQTTDFASIMPPLPGVTPADTSQFIAMLDRPVFSLSRRPPPPPAPPESEQKPPEDNLSTAQLSGLYKGEGAGGAIIQIAGKNRRMQLKDVVEGWTLQSIQERSVTFMRAGKSRELQLPRAALTTYSGIGPGGSAAGSVQNANGNAGVDRRAPPAGRTAGRSAINQSQPDAQRAPRRASFAGR